MSVVVSDQQRMWRPSWACPVGVMMSQHRRGGSDPSWLRTARGWLWASNTPVGQATLFVEPLASEGLVRGSAWGPGAEWTLEAMPRLLGAMDEPPSALAPHPAVNAAVLALPNWRRGRTDLIVQALVPVVIEQKVTGQEAFDSWRLLVRRHGQPAPGPAAARGLMVPPANEVLAALPSWEWIRASVDHARAAAITQALRRASTLERVVAENPERAESVLTSVPGIGVWTSSEVRQRALGDPDAVSFGDYHVAKDVGWAVAGRAFSDAELEEFLEPWSGQRGRVVSLVLRHFGASPRHGARMEPRPHVPGVRWHRP